MSPLMSAVIAPQHVQIKGGVEFDIPQKVDAETKRIDAMNVTVTDVIPNLAPIQVEMHTA